MVERRHSHLRRALAAGAVLGVLGMLPLLATELAYVLVVRRPTFDDAWQLAAFVALLLTLPLGFAALTGPIAGMLLLAIGQLAERLAPRRVGVARVTARLVSVLALPGIAVIVAQLFAGRRAQQLPARQLVAAAIGLLGVGLTYGVVRAVLEARERLRLRRWREAHALLLASSLLLVGAGCYVADQRVLVGLYRFFHALLALAAVLCSQLAVTTLYAAWRPTHRRLGRLLKPRNALLLAAVLVTVSCWGLSRLQRSAPLRLLLLRHATLQQQLLRLAPLTRQDPSGAARLVPAGVAQPSATPLREGPHRGDASLLLISVDALRADHLGTYGYHRPTSPHIDQWARQAVVFERGYCPVPHTSFSLTSLLTGKHMYSATEARQRTLAAVLRRYGYKTGGFFPPAVFYIDGARFSAFAATKFDFEYLKYEFLAAEPRVDQVIDFLGREGQGKFFVWVHFFEPHEPYQSWPGLSFGARAIDRYDSEIAYTDRAIGRLIAYVRRAHPRTIVALTGDHGEAFGEHGAYYHGNAIYEEQVRVPMIISVPELPARRVPGSVQSIDLAPTMLSLIDVPVPAAMQGHDLGPWLVGEPPAHLPPAYFTIEDKKAVVDGQRKLIWDSAWGVTEVYDLLADPAERSNLSSRQPAVTGALRAQLDRALGEQSARRARSDGEGDAQRLLARARLRDLATVPGLLRLFRRRDSELRRQVVTALTALRSRDALPALREARSDPDPGVAIPALIGAALLGDRGSAGQVAALVQARGDLPPVLRRAALLALAGSADRRHRGPGLTLELAHLLQGSRDIYDRLELIDALGALGDARAVPALLQQLETVRTHLAAIDALGALRSPAALPELVALLRADRYTNARQHAALALGRIGDSRAIAPLQEAVRRELEGPAVAGALVALQTLGALPVAGLRPLSGRDAWDCGTARCRLVAEAHCGRREELLLLVAPTAASAGTTGWGEAGGALRVLCGDQAIGRIELGRVAERGHDRALELPALVAALGGQRGRLVLEAPRGSGGAPTVAVQVLALRPTPKAAVAVAPAQR
ncbi:MAG: sulfatase-like hydrolase/transferase [Proteobacteria bacterium]|nr:sulfatase-like hydrolase/transferase [Pseudomonadota bacterium]